MQNQYIYGLKRTINSQTKTNQYSFQTSTQQTTILIDSKNQRLNQNLLSPFQTMEGTFSHHKGTNTNKRKFNADSTGG